MDSLKFHVRGGVCSGSNRGLCAVGRKRLGGAILTRADERCDARREGWVEDEGGNRSKLADGWARANRTRPAHGYSSKTPMRTVDRGLTAAGKMFAGELHYLCVHRIYCIIAALASSLCGVPAYQKSHRRTRSRRFAQDLYVSGSCSRPDLRQSQLHQPWELLSHATTRETSYRKEQ